MSKAFDRFKWLPRPSAKGATAALALTCALAGCGTPGSHAPGPAGEQPNYDSQGQARAVQVRQTARGVQVSADERVLFDTGKAELKREAQVYVERVATLLKTKTQAGAVIEGHTDNQGSAALNQQLSSARAQAVRTALVAQGVPAERLQAQGFGFSRPVADNATPEGRQANRRTDIIVLGETVEKIAGPGPQASEALSDSLSAGLDRFLKNATDFIKNVFGNGADNKPQ